MACAEALATGAASRDVVLNILSRTYDDPVTSECDTPLHLPELMAPLPIVSVTTNFSRRLPMLRDKLLETMERLALHGMKSAFAEVLAAAIKQRKTPEKILLDLLEAEQAERTARSIRYRLGLARFPVDKDIDRFDFSASPVNESLVRSLHQSQFLSTKSNVILVGGTGTARLTWQSPWPARPSRAVSSMWSIWSISLSRKSLPAGAEGWLPLLHGGILSCLRRWGICRFQKTAGSFCFI
jgi:hypothetical protein